MVDTPTPIGVLAVYKTQATTTFSNTTLGTTEVNVLEVGSLTGTDHYRLDGLNGNVAALGTGTTTVRFRIYAEVNGVSVLVATINRTATGGFSGSSELPIASRYLKVTVARVEGTGTDGSASVSTETSKATA